MQAPPLSYHTSAGAAPGVAMIKTILIVLAFVCFALAAAGVPSGRLNLIGLGLAAWTLSLILA